jgi:hypothetical protein
VKAKELGGSELRSWVLVFAAGDDVLPELGGFARDRRLTAASFTAIGAFEEVTVAWFNPESKEYEDVRIDEQVEVLVLAGDVALAGDEPAIHAHVVVGRRGGATAGGHLVQARVRPTLELVLTESPAELRKRRDPETGLALIELDD